MRPPPPGTFASMTLYDSHNGKGLTPCAATAHHTYHVNGQEMKITQRRWPRPFHYYEQAIHAYRTVKDTYQRREMLFPKFYKWGFPAILALIVIAMLWPH